jgi:hypothetical protein
MVTVLWAVGLERITPKYVHIFQCMIERTDAITNEVLEPNTFVLAYPAVVPSREVLETHPPFDHAISITGSMDHTAVQQQHSPQLAAYQISAYVLQDI